MRPIEALVLPGTTADRIEAWIREDPGFEGMTLGDLISDRDLLNCLVALRLIERRMIISPDSIECPACVRRFRLGESCELANCFLKPENGLTDKELLHVVEQNVKLECEVCARSKWKSACPECNGTEEITVDEKIKYWWSEDRQFFCILVNDGVTKATVSLSVDEAEALMGEVMQTPSFPQASGGSFRAGKATHE